MLSIIYENIFNLAIKILSVAELFVVVAVCTQDDEKILSTSLKSPCAELLVEIASIDFLLAEVALSNLGSPDLKFRLAKSTTSSMDGRS